MKTLIFCPLWGLDHLPLENALQKIKEAGYEGVEMALPETEPEQKKLRALLGKHGLEIIASQFLAGGADKKEHLARFEELLRGYAKFKPLFINSHTGKDFYPFEWNAEFLETAARIEKETGIEIVHETHRGRFSYAAAVTKTYLDAFPDLKLNADFSHWCNVSESLLADQPENVEAGIAQAAHVHARVGHAQGPQVSDPRAPEWQEALNAHLAWWDKIWETRKAAGKKFMTFTTEFGPDPYLPCLPYTRQPVASQWDINVFMMRLLKTRYGTAQD